MHSPPSGSMEAPPPAQNLASYPSVPPFLVPAPTPFLPHQFDASSTQIISDEPSISHLPCATSPLDKDCSKLTTSASQSVTVYSDAATVPSLCPAQYPVFCRDTCSSASAVTSPDEPYHSTGEIYSSRPICNITNSVADISFASPFYSGFVPNFDYSNGILGTSPSACMTPLLHTDIGMTFGPASATDGLVNSVDLPPATDSLQVSDCLMSAAPGSNPTSRLAAHFTSKVIHGSEANSKDFSELHLIPSSLAE